MRDDVGTNPSGGGGRECHDWHLRESGAEFGQLSIFGTEVMTPFGNAMRFVDRQANDVPFFQILIPAVEHQAFGSGVEQFEFSAVQATQAITSFVCAES